MPLGTQVVWLFVLAIPVACVAWTVTHEDVFREPREFCAKRSERCRHWYQRKFFYLLTCEYCFSHYVTALVLVMTRFQLLYIGWRGYVLAAARFQRRTLATTPLPGIANQRRVFVPFRVDL